jgi:diguanylate cyclase (GGDEF)-like protein
MMTYTVLLMVAGLACLIVAAIVWQQRRMAAGAIPLIVFMIALSWWDLAYAVFWAGVAGPTPFFWLDITYLGVVITPPAFLAFALLFTQLGHWLHRPLTLALMIEPILVIALLWTDPWHGLFFAGKRALNSGMILDAGPVFWANIAYSYTLMLIGCILLVRHYQQSTGLYRQQAALLLAAAVVPWLNNLVFVLRLSPLPGVDNTPFAFSITALMFAYALWHYRLLDVVPIARHLLIERMSDGVLVLDAQNRVVDINRAAQQATGAPHTSPIGRPLEQVFTAWADLIGKSCDASETQAEIVVGEAAQRHLDLRILPLLNQRHALVGRLIVWRDITELKRTQAELQRLATSDELTQVHNRRHFLDLAQAELARTIRFSHPMALVFIDIDRFKEINDTLGHAGGDQALAAIAKLCLAQIRAIDIFARLGGEEFVLLLPETDSQTAALVAERLRQAVSQTPITHGGHAITATISLGVATVSGGQSTLELLMQRADQALYSAKQAGRNRVAVWHES